MTPFGGVAARPERLSAVSPTGSERRVVELDGLRGLMTLIVIVSHYFGELPHGLVAISNGWVEVDMFFVLSGFLIENLSSNGTITATSSWSSVCGAFADSYQSTSNDPAGRLSNGSYRAALD